jgi:ribosomal protein S2
MERTVGLIDTEMDIVGVDITLPCDDDGTRA